MYLTPFGCRICVKCANKERSIQHALSVTALLIESTMMNISEKIREVYNASASDMQANFIARGAHNAVVKQ